MKAQSIVTLPILGITPRIELTSTGIPGTRLSALNGRRARTERMTE